MPTVSYMRPQQGFRPATNPRGAMGAAKRRGMGAINTFSGCVQAYDADGNPVACNDPSAAVWMDVNGNAVAPGTPVAAAIPTGAILTYTGQWQTTSTKSANDIIQAVIAGVRANGLSVANFATTAGILANTKLVGFAESGQTFTVTLQLQVTGPGFAQAADAGLIVDHLVYAASGMMPLSSNTIAGGSAVSPVSSTTSILASIVGNSAQQSGAASGSWGPAITTIATVVVVGWLAWKLL